MGLALLLVVSMTRVCVIVLGEIGLVVKQVLVGVTLWESKSSKSLRHQPVELVRNWS